MAHIKNPESRMQTRFVVVTKVDGNKVEFDLDGLTRTVETPKGYRYSVGSKMKLRRGFLGGWQHAEV